MRGSVPLLALFGAAKAECLIAPMGLSVDYWAPKDFAADVLAWVDPAVDPAVRFSWQLAGSARGAAQAKYQLQVAAAGSATAPLWDSGMVTSNRTLHVPYGGDTPLEPDRRYSWRVRVADGSGGRGALVWSQNLHTMLRLAAVAATAHAALAESGGPRCNPEQVRSTSFCFVVCFALLFRSPFLRTSSAPPLSPLLRAHLPLLLRCRLRCSVAASDARLMCL